MGTKESNKEYNTKLIIVLVLIGLFLHSNPQFIILLFIGIAIIAYLKYGTKSTTSTNSFCPKCGNKI